MHLVRVRSEGGWGVCILVGLGVRVDTHPNATGPYPLEDLHEMGCDFRLVGSS